MDTKELITRESVMGEIVDKYGQDAVGILMQYGIHCVGCAFNAFDTVENGAKLHGFSDEEVEHLISDLNRVIAK